MFNSEIILKIKDKLIASEQTVAVAESVTAGLLQAALASAESAEKFFHGGITTYNLGQKSKHLDINSIHALNCNCVSKKMAHDMAISVCHKFNSDWGIGITGYATPTEQSKEKQFAWYGIAFQGNILEAKIISQQSNRAYKLGYIMLNVY